MLSRKLSLAPPTAPLERRHFDRQNMGSLVGSNAPSEAINANDIALEEEVQNGAVQEDNAPENENEDNSVHRLFPIDTMWAQLQDVVGALIIDTTNALHSLIADINNRECILSYLAINTQPNSEQPRHSSIQSSSNAFVAARISNNHDVISQIPIQQNENGNVSDDDGNENKQQHEHKQEDENAADFDNFSVPSASPTPPPSQYLISRPQRQQNINHSLPQHANQQIIVSSPRPPRAHSSRPTPEWQIKKMRSMDVSNYGKNGPLKFTPKRSIHLFLEQWHKYSATMNYDTDTKLRIFLSGHNIDGVVWKELMDEQDLWDQSIDTEIRYNQLLEFLKIEYKEENKVYFYKAQVENMRMGKSDSYRAHMKKFQKVLTELKRAMNIQNAVQQSIKYEMYSPHLLTEKFINTLTPKKIGLLLNYLTAHNKTFNMAWNDFVPLLEEFANISLQREQIFALNRSTSSNTAQINAIGDGMNDSQSFGDTPSGQVGRGRFGQPRGPRLPPNEYKEKVSRQKCRFGKKCKFGLKCWRMHSKEDREYFHKLVEGINAVRVIKSDDVRKDCYNDMSDNEMDFQ